MPYSLWFFLFFVLGLVAAAPLVIFSQKLRLATTIKLLGRCLLIAAVIYMGFAFIWGNTTWIGIELAGVILYGIFYWLAVRHSILWLAAGWLLHPVWDAGLHLWGPGSAVAPDWYAVACLSFDFVIAGYCVYRAKTQTSENIKPLQAV